MSRSISVSTEVYIDDVLDEISTDDLVKELQSRKGRDPTQAYPTVDFDRDWLRLADFIAEGNAAEALDLLNMLSPVKFSVPVVRNIINARYGRVA